MTFSKERQRAKTNNMRKSNLMNLKMQKLQTGNDANIYRKIFLRRRILYTFVLEDG